MSDVVLESMVNHKVIYTQLPPPLKAGKSFNFRGLWGDFHTYQLSTQLYIQRGAEKFFNLRGTRCL